MKVVLDTYGWPGDDGPDVISVRLDDGTEVYAASIVDDPEAERAELERALRRLVDAEIGDFDHVNAERMRHYTRCIELEKTVHKLEHALAEREARIEWWQRRWDARAKEGMP